MWQQDTPKPKRKVGRPKTAANLRSDRIRKYKGNRRWLIYEVPCRYCGIPVGVYGSQEEGATWSEISQERKAKNNPRRTCLVCIRDIHHYRLHQSFPRRSRFRQDASILWDTGVMQKLLR